MEKYILTRMVHTRLPTEAGDFDLYLYHNNIDDKEHLALTRGTIAGQQNVLVRVHSECFTGDVLSSRRCDCGEQLRRALQAIAAERQGVLIYLRQEGRGIGLLDKLRAYNLQDQGYDTVEANLLLGHQADERDYHAAAKILEDLRVQSIRLLTNNPDKIAKMRSLGIKVSARVPLEATVHADNAGYLLTKATRMHHLLNPGLLQTALTHLKNGRSASIP